MSRQKSFEWKTPQTRVVRHIQMTEAYPVAPILMRAGYRPTYETLMREGYWATAAKLYPRGAEEQAQRQLEKSAEMLDGPGSEIDR